MATIGGRNMQQFTLFIMQEIYISVHALVGRIANNDLWKVSLKLVGESFAVL
jgi:hypothetical protein